MARQPPAAGRTGRASFDVLFPIAITRLGEKTYTQFLCLDPGANVLGLTTSNGIVSTVGR